MFAYACIILILDPRTYIAQNKNYPKDDQTKINVNEVWGDLKYSIWWKF